MVNLNKVFAVKVFAVAAFMLLASSVMADPVSNLVQDVPSDPNLEHCRVVDADGNGLIKQNMADSGPNLEGDAEAWIIVPRGQCAKINAGDFSGVKPEIKNKIDTTAVDRATPGNLD